MDYNISVLPTKLSSLQKLIHPVIQKPSQKITIHHLAKIIGKIVSLFPASVHAKLHYRLLDRCKVKALQQHGSCWDAKIKIDNSAISELRWWHSNLQGGDRQKFTRSLHVPPVDVEMFTDACDYGFGHVINQDSQQGLFTENQRHLSINTKELLAI